MQLNDYYANNMINDKDNKDNRQFFSINKEDIHVDVELMAKVMKHPEFDDFAGQYNNTVHLLCEAAIGEFLKLIGISGHKVKLKSIDYDIIRED